MAENQSAQAQSHLGSSPIIHALIDKKNLEELFRGSFQKGNGSKIIPKKMYPQGLLLGEADNMRKDGMVTITQQSKGCTISTSPLLKLVVVGMLNSKNITHYIA